MTPSAVIQAAFIGLLVVSTTFADVKSQNKNEKKRNTLVVENINSPFSYPSSFTFGAKSFGSSTPAPFLFGNSFSSNALSNAAAVQYIDRASSVKSSIPAAFNDGSFVSSTPSVLIGSSTPAPFLSGAAVSDASLSGAYAPAFGAAFTKSESFNNDAVIVPVSNAPVAHQQVTIAKEVAVPYYVQIEKKVPYPVYVRVPQPYPVAVEKHVPYAVRVNVDRPIHVPQPYPVEIEKRVPYPVEKPVPYEVRVPVDRPYPVHVPIEKPVPYAVEKPVPYPVRVNVDRPYPVEKPVPYPVPVEKPVPYPVEKAVPYPVEKLVPYPVEKSVPYPVKYEVPVKVPVPVEVRVPVSVDRPVPYPVEKRVPYPVQVPVEVKVPVPVAAPAQRFATVHYYQQSPVGLGYESSQAFAGQSGYKALATQSNSGAFFSSTASPISTYSSTVSPDGLFGSNVAQEGFVGSSAAPFSFGEQSFFGSSTPTPFSSGIVSTDSSPLLKSASAASAANQETVAIGGSSLKSQELKADNFDVLKK